MLTRSNFWFHDLVNFLLGTKWGRGHFRKKKLADYVYYKHKFWLKGLITQPIGAFFFISHTVLSDQKQREMEMEEGSARVSWYERQLLIGPNHIFHRLLMEGRKSFKREIGCVILYTFRRKLVDNLLCLKF